MLIVLLINSDFHSYPEFADEAGRHHAHRLPSCSSMLTDSAGPSQRDENFSIKPETTYDGQGGQHKTKKHNRSALWVISQPPHKGDKKCNESVLKVSVNVGHRLF